MVLPLALSTGASAADTDTTSSSDSAATSATKSARVDVTAGVLTITKTGTNDADQMAPSFQFSNANVSTKSQTVSPMADGGFKNVNNAADSYDGSVLSVDDNSGSGAGWHVTAQLAAFSDGANHDLSGAVLHMASADTKSDDTDKAATAPNADLKAGGDAATVFNATAGDGLGNSTADFKDATLTLPQAEYAGNYTADLTYQLTSGPTA